MKQYTYNPNITGLTIITDPNKQYDLLFSDGHPRFLIPDFNAEPTDIWLSYEDYIEKTLGAIYDQNGGEITSHTPIGNGLVRVEYTLDDISLESDPDNYKQYHITIEGYVAIGAPLITSNGTVTNDGAYFLATKVTGDL